MSIKRTREQDSNNTARPTKRIRTDPELAKIWECLADEDEDTRLNAAYDLLENHGKFDDMETAKPIVRRLIKGLCSSRKGARPGFYIALVGALSRNDSSGTAGISLADLLSLLEAETTPERGTSGEDERAHFFGRLLGCKALIESEALWGREHMDRKAWTRVLDTVAALMAQKPWLRSEASSIICSAISGLARYNESDRASAISEVFTQLKRHKLTRTIDGIYLWLHVQNTMPKAKVLQDVWSGNTPLTTANLPKSSNSPEDDALGTSVWTPKLHSVWQLLMHKIGRTSSPKEKLVTFSQFWQEVVEEGLFHPSATPERKFTGFLVLECALKEVAVQHITACFSKNLMSSMIQALRSPDETYLRSVIGSVFAKVLALFREHNDSTKASQVVHGLLEGCGFADFDPSTKSDIVASFMETCDLGSDGADKYGVGAYIWAWTRDTPGEHEGLAKTANRRKNILNVLQRELCRRIRRTADKGYEASLSEWRKLDSVICDLMQLRKAASGKGALKVPWDESSQIVLTEKISQVLEVMLTTNHVAQCKFFGVVTGLEADEVEAEESIKQTVDTAWRLLHTVKPDEKKKETLTYLKSRYDPRKQSQWTPQHGMAFLLATLLFDVLNGDADSVEILGDATAMARDLSTIDSSTIKATEIADHVIDIILSLVSRASKLHRRVASIVFDTFASKLSIEGLKILSDVLTTKEGREGQLELFENGDADLEVGSDEDIQSDQGNSDKMSSVDSDVEVIDGANDSDVEEASAASEGEEADSESDDSADEDEDEDSEADDELANFESALAAALGTRKLNRDDLIDANASDATDTSSDSDMSDSEMMEVDTKLVEVFRNQQSQASAQKVKKEELKSAKENVVNLKNRAMDLTELFLRSQQERGRECLELLSSLLQMAKATGTPQLANRALNIAKNYAQKAKAPKLPKVKKEQGVRDVLLLRLQELHSMVVERAVSNALIDVAGQLNVLICKLLIESGVKNIKSVIESISSETKSRDQVKRKALMDFWSRYDAWAGAKEVEPDKSSKPGKGSAKGSGTEKPKKRKRSRKSA